MTAIDEGLVVSLYDKLDAIQIKAQNLYTSLEDVILLYTNCKKDKIHDYLSNKKNYEYLSESERECVKLLVTYQLMCLKICHNSSRSMVKITNFFHSLLKNDNFLENNFKIAARIIRIFEKKIDERKANDAKLYKLNTPYQRI